MSGNSTTNATFIARQVQEKYREGKELNLLVLRRPRRSAQQNAKRSVILELEKEACVRKDGKTNKDDV